MYVEQKLIKISSVANTFMDHLQDSDAAKSLCISTARCSIQVAMAKASRTLPRWTWALRDLHGRNAWESAGPNGPTLSKSRVSGCSMPSCLMRLSDVALGEEMRLGERRMCFSMFRGIKDDIHLSRMILLL